MAIDQDIQFFLPSHEESEKIYEKVGSEFQIRTFK
jgi:hypothetical protein